MITQEFLKSILHYSPCAGVFTWINPVRPSSMNHGGKAGHTHKRTGYVSITINRKFNAAHRLAWLYMTGEYPKNEIDHINQIKSDNRWINLRDVTTSENLKNKRLRKDNTSGISGVFLEKATGKWEVKIRSGGASHYFGRFDDIEKAISVRNKAIADLGFSELHGRF